MPNKHSLQQRIARPNTIGTVLSTERDLPRLLETILLDSPAPAVAASTS